jgi:hypothetical protein
MLLSVTLVTSVTGLEMPFDIATMKHNTFSRDEPALQPTTERASTVLRRRWSTCSRTKRALFSNHTALVSTFKLTRITIRGQATKDDPFVLLIMDENVTVMEVMDGLNEMDCRLDNIYMVLDERSIHLNKREDNDGIFEFVDAFVHLTRYNQSVEEVELCLPFIDPDDDTSWTHRYAIWDKIAEGIGNLQALREIVIWDAIMDDEEEDALAPDWETLACILRRLRRGIDLRMEDDKPLLWDTEALPVLAETIHGQAMITGFCTGNVFPFHCLDILCSALLTLPALENVAFQHITGEGPEEGQSLESMIKLLQSLTLRLVRFADVDFTNTLCQAVAKALRERSEITEICFPNCSFPEGGTAVIASALTTNRTLEGLEFDVPADEVFCEVLATALLTNSTLQVLEFSISGGFGHTNTESCSWLSPLFLALQVNKGLKMLSIRGFELINEKLSSAMRLGLGNNSTLETLDLKLIKLGDNDTCLWREALSFLRTNAALKTLCIGFKWNTSNSHVATIRTEVLAMLRENESLVALSLTSPDFTFEDYLVAIPEMQPNTTLKKLSLHGEAFSVDDDKMKVLFPVLKKNYGLEEFPGLCQDADFRSIFPGLCHDDADFRSIFDLNRAGRRYLVQDGSSISKGVDVLSRVNDDINSVFLHLLENPRLCDRGAVEMSSSSIGNMDNAGSTSPGNRHNGDKREQQAPSQLAKETRRRLE